MLVLGIETSCDETSASVVEDGKNILSNKITSSLDLHKEYGGVVPEIACRYHLECINYVIKEALNEAGVSLEKIDLIAVTHGPGLTGALLIGVSAAKALSYSLSIPIVGVNHLYAHMYSAMMGNTQIKFPCIGLVVSGGHTALVVLTDHNKLKLLGQTRDDAAGEAFDKSAKILGLGFPGGPIIEKRAREGNPSYVKFPRAYLEKGSFDFSFSGVKTALLYYARDNASTLTSTINDVCASFQQSIFDVIVDKAISACVQKQAKQLSVGGGVSKNKLLHAMLSEKGKKENVEVLFPDGGLCTDNAAMIAGAGYGLYKDGIVSDYSLDANPNLGLAS